MGAAYFVPRTVGKVLGAALGARIAGAPTVVNRHIGWCLLPRAGVALGLALLGAKQLGAQGSGLLALLLGTTFLFEVVGPICTRLVLSSAGEIPNRMRESPR